MPVTFVGVAVVRAARKMIMEREALRYIAVRLGFEGGMLWVCGLIGVGWFKCEREREREKGKRSSGLWVSENRFSDCGFKHLWPFLVLL